MSSKISVSCEACGATHSVSLGMTIKSLSVGGEINVEDPCLKCGGHLSAPGGRYEYDEASGELVRTGDFDPPSSPSFN